MQIQEENRASIIELLEKNQFIAIDYGKKEIVQQTDNANSVIKTPKKVSWCHAGMNTDFLSDEEAADFLLDFTEKGLPKVTERLEEFHPKLNVNGFINNSFLPIFFMYKHKNGWLVCDSKMDSYPTQVIWDYCLFQDEMNVIESSMLNAKDILPEPIIIPYGEHGKEVINSKVVPVAMIDSSLKEFQRLSQSQESIREILDSMVGVASIEREIDISDKGREPKNVLKLTNHSQFTNEELLGKLTNNGQNLVFIRPIGTVLEDGDKINFELVTAFVIIVEARVLETKTMVAH